jgi:hypothetical protein
MNNIFNGNIAEKNIFGYPQLTSEQEQLLLAELFEQLILFDKITIKTGRLNFTLHFLIHHLGINLVEELVEKGLIQFLLWTPVIVTGSGTQREDGTIDESTIIGKPPIATGQLSNEDLDPENNIKKGLQHYNLHRDRRRIFTRKALKNYVIPEGMEFSKNAAEFITESYNAGHLRDLGLPNTIEPENLNVDQRYKLLNLGSKVLETSVMSKYELKSLENYEHIKIFESNLNNIGKAYNVTSNTSDLLKLEKVPNLRELYLQEGFDFQIALKIRNLSNAKYFRKWINEVSESVDANEITTEYLKQIKGETKFFETGHGKFLKTSLMCAAGTALGMAISNPIGGSIAGFTLSQLDTFWLDKLLKGKNPSMFIEDLKYEQEEEKNRRQTI